MLSAAGYPIVLYGAWQLPPILPHDVTLYAFLRAAHTVLAFMLFLTILAHLGDGGIVAVTRSSEELAGDLEQAAVILDAVRSGWLPPTPNLHVCMRCGHFVSCPATGARRGDQIDCHVMGINGKSLAGGKG